MLEIYLPAILLEIPRNIVTAIGLPLCLGILSGSGTAKVVKSNWYKASTSYVFAKASLIISKDLHGPPGRPPRQVFPIVWPLLYLSMGYVSHLAVNALDATSSPSTRSDVKLGIALYYAQLAMNFIWSPLFFNGKKLGLALIDSVVLAGTTFYMTKLLDGPTKSQSTYLLLPYCAWLTFATYLNGGIWWLNRGRTPEKD
ncbi:TspO/MBR family-domain-containing protein [Desarmillaria tabescens]|uniref:TspO/MBR family-domain-containing protein n=1 Tax=Armillaria tabescens TaxID=1929756 RepID=A0AA39U7A1_ARMTA|nr:TspO/MBR family-domain-containing protein [Desarmillaria tabescens]KAK0468480.1 TspO/MBR family-domain-containing protein [Desarmillaria tabescens]